MEREVVQGVISHRQEVPGEEDCMALKQRHSQSRAERLPELVSTYTGREKEGERSNRLLMAEASL